MKSVHVDMEPILNGIRMEVIFYILKLNLIIVVVSITTVLLVI